MHGKLKDPKKFVTPAPNKYEVRKIIDFAFYLEKKFNQTLLVAGHSSRGTAILCFWCEALSLPLLWQAGDRGLHQGRDGEADRGRVQAKRWHLYQGQANCS